MPPAGVVWLRALLRLTGGTPAGGVGGAFGGGLPGVGGGLTIAACPDLDLTAVPACGHCRLFGGHGNSPGDMAGYRLSAAGPLEKRGMQCTDS